MIATTVADGRRERQQVGDADGGTGLGHADEVGMAARNDLTDLDGSVRTAG